MFWNCIYYVTYLSEKLKGIQLAVTSNASVEYTGNVFKRVMKTLKKYNTTKSYLGKYLYSLKFSFILQMLFAW